MKKPNIKEIKEQCATMSSGWGEGAPDVEFNGFKLAEFNAERTAAQAVEDEISDLEAQIKMKKDERDTRYIGLDSKRSKVRSGVAGHKDYGDDSQLYGAMGFVRKSERKSGLTHKKKNSGGGNEGGGEDK
jgi:hypothetical protein